MTKLTSLILITLTLSFSGCAAMMASYREAYCNYDGAYKAGMNDSRQGKEMNVQFAHPCNASVRATAERGYREGYTNGAAGGIVTIAPRPQQCVTAGGQRVCGYSCVQAYGKAACAQSPDHNCIEAYGKLRCGPNCREEFGKIVCGPKSMP